MARNPSEYEDILYKCTIDNIRLISDLQDNYKGYFVLVSIKEARLELNFEWLNWEESRKLVIANSW